MKKKANQEFRIMKIQAALVLWMMTIPITAIAAEELSLTVDEAVTRALSSDQRIRSSYERLQSARLHVDATRQERYPSLSLGAGYTRLSHVSSSVDIGPTSFDIDSQDNLFSMSAKMGYTLFDGFSRRKSETLAELQARGQEISSEQMRQTVIFQTRQAYWEAVRMENNASMLRKNLSLSQQSRDITKNKFEEGTVLRADLLAAEMRCDQAQMDLEAAELSRDRAYLNLSTLVESWNTDVSDSNTTFDLRSNPAPSPLDSSLPGDRDLLSKAFLGRPESLIASLAVDQGETGESLLKSALAPTLAVSGNYTYASPNSRVLLQSHPQFTGTWAVGLTLSYDLGQIPSHLSAIASKEAEIESLKADRERQEELIALDVKNCLLNYRQTERDISLVTGMLSQARENERVMAQRVSSGTASDVDQLGASLVRLQGEFAIINKQIDLQIAAADLIRAAALESEGE